MPKYDQQEYLQMDKFPFGNSPTDNIVERKYLQFLKNLLVWVFLFVCFFILSAALTGINNGMYIKMNLLT